MKQFLHIPSTRYIMDHIPLLCLSFKKTEKKTNEQHQIEIKNMGTATADIHLWKTTEEESVCCESVCCESVCWTWLDHQILCWYLIITFTSEIRVFIKESRF